MHAPTHHPWQAHDLPQWLGLHATQGMDKGGGPPLRPPGEGADYMPTFAQKAALHL